MELVVPWKGALFLYANVKFVASGNVKMLQRLSRFVLFNLRRLSIAVFGLWISSAAIAQPQGGAEVSFPTQNRDGTVTQLRAILFKPAALPNEAKGAVVLVHGSSGWTDFREGHYGRALSMAGYAVLAIDSFGPRGIAGIAEDQSRLTALQMTMDSFSARRHLISMGYDQRRMAVMGFSKGGLVSLLAADRTFLPDEVDRFAAAIAFYPGCNNRPREPKPASVLFMALGEKDDYTGVKPCKLIADDYARAGGKVKVTVYPGATHGFDGSPENVRAYRAPTVENYIDCIADVEPDGVRVLNGKRFAPQEDAALTAEAKKTCMKKGATMWTNLSQKAQATADVISFLNEAIRP
jgi:dienelactone hydrolase